MSRPSLLVRSLGIAVLAAAALGAAAAGSETGEIKGLVVDDQGQTLPGVEITASGPALQGRRAALAGREGTFHIPLLPVGTYKLTFKLSGFVTVIQENVQVRLGQTTALRIVLAPAALEKEITVRAEAPLLDKTSTDTSHLLSATDLSRYPAQNRTIADAVKTVAGAAGVRASTRRGTSAEGLPSFRGEGEEGNNWIVDGLSISGVRLKDAGVRINFDSIEEAQIISDPFSPEFGSAYGGIINMVTRSGGNNVRGEFSLIFMDRSLQAERRPQLSVVSEPSYFSNANGYFNLGGPILKDRLWFFLSENFYSSTRETAAGTLDYFAVPGGKLTERNNNLFGKLTLALNANHSLSLTAMVDTSLPQRGGIDIPEMIEVKSYTDTILRLNYKGILDAQTYVEAGFGRVSRRNLKRPDDEDLQPAMYFVQDLARAVHNSYGRVTDDEKRLDASAKITRLVPTETFGQHELTAGFEVYDISSHFAVDFTGQGEDVFPGNAYDAGTEYFFTSWEEGRRTPSALREYGIFDLANSSRGIGLYIKDKVTWGRFTFMAGLRTQTQDCRDDQGRSLWSWGLSDFLSPRFSLTVDLTRDGVNLIKVAWGRFSDLITTMPLGFFNANALKYRLYDWTGSADPSEAALHDPANWAFSSEFNMKFETAEGIEPDFQSRWLVEYDRRLGPDWAARARFIRAKSDNLLEVLAVFDPQTIYKFLYDNFEYKRRDYTGFEIEVSGKFGPILAFNASYAYGLARGTNPGQSESGSWSQEEGSTNYVGLFGKHLYVPPIAELAPLKDWADTALAGLGGRGIGDEGWYGRLPYSVEHTIKINAAAALPFGILAAAAFEYDSGYPWEKLGYVPFFGGYYAYPEGRGSNTSPAHAVLDLALEKTFRLPARGWLRDAALSVRLDVFNVFNSQEAVSFVKEDIPLYGSVWGRQAPRQARLTAKFKF